ncbi:MAG: Hsp33 family molecular chaperone HslO [Cyanobacteria bacterium]|nr:Hsp33 family molecular chaperone HslO [Cyanobacteriota bacterium]
MTDHLIRATAADGGIRIVGVTTTQLVQAARQRHGLSYVATAALGRAMAAGLLLVSSMKRPESRVNVRIRGDGPLGGVLVDAGLDGTVRGYVDHGDIELPPNADGKLDVGSAIGRNGYLYVVRDVGYGQPYASTVELVSGEIGEDLTYYLATSEQTPSALVLGVFVGADGVEAAGGLLLQVLPKAARDESLITLLESRMAQLSSFTTHLRDHQTLPEIFASLVGDLDLTLLPGEQAVRFHCPCSSNRMLGALKMLGAEELQDMIEKDDGAEATCHFCGEVYRASASDLSQLIEDLRLEKSGASS